MPIRDHIKYLAFQRMLYTGEPEAHAISDLRADPDRLLPVISSERSPFDASVMAQLVRAGGFYWAHPFGIKGVWSELGKTIIGLDHSTILGTNEHHLMGDFTLRNLLPYLRSDFEVSGVEGLRIGSVDGRGRRDLHLFQLQGPGHVVLRASKGTDWGQILRIFEQDMHETGSRPLWNERSLSTDEADQESQSPLFLKNRRDIAWIGAALLQRINLFHSVSRAYTTSSWVNGDRWIFEMEGFRVSGRAHDDFLAHLTNRHWGLDLRTERVNCRCAELDRERAVECRFQLSDAGTRQGSLELRFCRTVRHRDVHRAVYERVGAARDWLDRVLPLRHQDGQSGDVQRLPGFSVADAS
ncbi:hypothetical protein ACI2K4_09315 [Micromonospora sp. NPDC050397]|uniref:hypothetical protein n=1 Tax=Micromonospora sp. NPDC050397 TaxID=3364279 RepID=UPI00384E9C67